MQPTIKLGASHLLCYRINCQHSKNKNNSRSQSYHLDVCPKLSLDVYLRLNTGQLIKQVIWVKNLVFLIKTCKQLDLSSLDNVC